MKVDLSKCNAALAKRIQDQIALEKSGETQIKKQPVKRALAYDKDRVIRWAHLHNLPNPEFEVQFNPERKWRIDIAFIRSQPFHKVALEVQGGIFINGGHNRGAQIVKEWEKYHSAQFWGWQIVWCQPDDLLTTKTAEIIKDLLA